MQKVLLFVPSIIVVLLSTIVCSSCVTLPYRTVKTEDIKSLKSLSDKVGFSQTQGLIDFAEFADKRSLADRNVGEVKVGIVNNPVPLNLDVSVNTFVKNKFTEALSKRGLTVNQKSQFVIYTDILDFKVKEHSDGWSFESVECSLNLNFKIYNRSNNLLVYSGYMNSMAMGTDSIWDATDSAGPILLTCIEICAEKFVNQKDLKQFLN